MEIPMPPSSMASACWCVPRCGFSTPETVLWSAAPLIYAEGWLDGAVMSANDGTHKDLNLGCAAIQVSDPIPTAKFASPEKDFAQVRPRCMCTYIAVQNRLPRPSDAVNDGDLPIQVRQK